VNNYIAIYLPLGLFYFLHFWLIKTLVKRSNLLLAICCLGISAIFSTLFFYISGCNWNRNNILSLLPTSYLVFAISIRYCIFNKYFAFLFKGKNFPYDPIMIYPGVFTVNWEDKNYTPYPVEYFYSFALLICPWFIFYYF
jgi:hypothetical protein